MNKKLFVIGQVLETVAFATFIGLATKKISDLENNIGGLYARCDALNSCVVKQQLRIDKLEEEVDPDKR